MREETPRSELLVQARHAHLIGHLFAHLKRPQFARWMCFQTSTFGPLQQEDDWRLPLHDHDANSAQVLAQFPEANQENYNINVQGLKLRLKRQNKMKKQNTGSTIHPVTIGVGWRVAEASQNWDPDIFQVNLYFLSCLLGKCQSSRTFLPWKIEIFEMKRSVKPLTKLHIFPLLCVFGLRLPRTRHWSQHDHWNLLNNRYISL